MIRILYFNQATVNLALGRPAFQSTTYHNNFASFAVDGNAETDLDKKHCAHGNDPSTGPNWLAVDLGRSYPIHRVVLTNRNCHPADCANRLDYFQVRVTNISTSESKPVKGSPPNCGQYLNQTLDGEQLAVACHSNTPPGRYVIIQQPTGGKGWLTICELEVYAIQDATYQQLQEQYVGCFEDKKDERDVKGSSLTLTTGLTVELCIKKCRNLQFTYAAVQNHTQCFCDNRYGLYGQIDDSLCDMKCVGDRRQICGGMYMNSIYTVCPRGYFGPNCIRRCHCSNRDICHYDNGTCPEDFNDGWSGLVETKSTILIEVIFGSILLVILIVIILLTIWRCRHERQTHPIQRPSYEPTLSSITDVRSNDYQEMRPAMTTVVINSDSRPILVQ